MVIEEVDHSLVDRTLLRISQYSRHIDELKKAGRESEGAEQVRDRLQASLSETQLDRDIELPGAGTRGIATRPPKTKP